jgi:hypothetical protein
VELHNFALNAILQVATFVGVCEGFLEIPEDWDLWVHLFRAELHTLTTQEPKTRRAVRTGGVTISLRETRRELYIPCTMSSNNAEWERGWFYLHNDEPGLPPWTGKVVREKADSWWHGVSPSACQDRLDSALQALKSLADAGLGAASVIANLHHRRIAPLMERRPPHFRDARGGRPRGAGAIMAAARSPSAGVHTPRGRGALSTSRPSGTTTPRSGRSSCSPTARW